MAGREDSAEGLEGTLRQLRAVAETLGAIDEAADASVKDELMAAWKRKRRHREPAAGTVDEQAAGLVADLWATLAEVPGTGIGTHSG